MDSTEPAHSRNELAFEVQQSSRASGDMEKGTDEGGRWSGPGHKWLAPQHPACGLTPILTRSC